MRHKKVENQIYRGKWGIQALKFKSTAVDWKFMPWKLNLRL